MFSYRILTQLKKLLQWRFFIAKALSFLHQFHQFPEKYLCEPSCFKNSGSQSGRKFLINTTVKFQVRNLNMIYKISQTENKEQKMIHPWFFQTSNSTQVCLSHLMLLLLAILIFDILTLSLVTVLAFHKDVYSILIFMLHTCVLFFIFFSVSKPKSDLTDKIFIKNQIAIKTNQTDL